GGLPEGAAQLAAPPSPVRHAQRPALLLRLLPDLLRADAARRARPARRQGGAALRQGRQLRQETGKGPQGGDGGGGMMTRQLAEWIWLIGGVAWFVVRFPHQRRARKVKVARSAGGL